ncbi:MULTISPECIES: hypothetical protein [Fischerella]|nr:MULTISPECIES: hypothetical protein [Fischerella]
MKDILISNYPLGSLQVPSGTKPRRQVVSPITYYHLLSYQNHYNPVI